MRRPKRPRDCLASIDPITRHSPPFNTCGRQIANYRTNVSVKHFVHNPPAATLAPIGTCGRGDAGCFKRSCATAIAR